jgi:hypothetical protein
MGVKIDTKEYSSNYEGKSFHNKWYLTAKLGFFDKVWPSNGIASPTCVGLAMTMPLRIFGWWVLSLRGGQRMLVDEAIFRPDQKFIKNA